MTPPSQYIVYRELPKPFWVFWGADRQEVTRLDALGHAGSPQTLGSRYLSEPLWNLPAPPKESGFINFRAWTDTGDASSGTLGSARIWLEEISSSGKAGASIGANISVPSLSIGPKVSADHDFERHWRVRVVEDPWVQITILQAGAVIDHLRLLEDEYDNQALQPHRGMWEIPDDTLTYFVDRPLEDVSLTHRLQPEEPLTIAVRVKDRQDLKAAICLRVQNLEDGSVTTTPPIFLTHFRDRLFSSHVTVEIFRREARDLLLMLGEERLNVETLSRRINRPVPETWSQLIRAADEFGADSIGAAAIFVAENTPTVA